MGISERKEREKARRRAAILKHTRDLIQKCGIASFSMQDIADRVEVSKATLYLYFKSKDELMGALVSSAREEFAEYVRMRVTDEMSGLESLRALWMCYLEMFGESTNFFLIAGIQNNINLNFNNREKLSDSDEKSFLLLFEMIERFIKKGTEDGSLLPDLNPQEITAILIFTASSIIQNTAILPEEMRNSNIVISQMRAIFEIILRGLAADNTDRAKLSLGRL